MWITINKTDLFMKKITGLLPALMLLHSIAFCQTDNIQQPTLGVHFFFHDFRSGILVRNNNLGLLIRDKQFGKIKEMSPGLALNYLEGLNQNFDFSTTLGFSFLDYQKRDGTSYGSDNLLIEGDVSIRGKMVSNDYWFIPYVQLGAGISKYKGYWGAFIPAGVGIQVNFFNEAYLLINSQYRFAVTETANYHFFHSIGLAGNIGTKKKKR